jgi:hypothetical protein
MKLTIAMAIISHYLLFCFPSFNSLKLCFGLFSPICCPRVQDHEEKSGWRRSWEDQISELKRRSMVKDSEENLSWGARMRRRRAEASSAE